MVAVRCSRPCVGQVRRRTLLGLEGSLQLVDDLIVRACDDAGIRGDGRQVAEFGAWFMAGADLPAEERALNRAIDRLGRTSRNSVANDTFAILRAGADDGWGVAVVVGAGINCVGRSPDGRRARFPVARCRSPATGAVGPTSVWQRSVPPCGQRMAVAARPGCAVTSPIISSVGGPTDVAIALASAAARTSDRLRELAPIVVAAAEAGDEAAVGILNRQADEVVSFVAAAIRRLRMARLEVPVVLGGSIMAALPARFVTRIQVG